MDAMASRPLRRWEEEAEETRRLPPRRLLQLALLPSLNRLTQRSARSLLYSSSSSVMLSIPPSLTSVCASSPVPPSLSSPWEFPDSAFSPNQFLGLSLHFIFFIVSLSSLYFLILWFLFFLFFPSLYRSLPSILLMFFLFRCGMRDEPAANPIPKAP